MYSMQSQHIRLLVGEVSTIVFLETGGPIGALSGVIALGLATHLAPIASDAISAPALRLWS